MRQDRVNTIEEYVIEHRTASLQELADAFGVSVSTIRRDLNSLFSRGNVSKVYGGVSVKDSSILPPIVERAAKNKEEKAVIGKLAAGMVTDNSVIFLDAGSTIPNMIVHLANMDNLTIVTHSLVAMSEAAKYPKLHVVALGGYYNHTTSSYSGDMNFLTDIQVQTVFLACSGMSTVGAGCSAYNEYLIKKQVASRGARVILLADHTKFNRPASFCSCPISRLSAIVTGQTPPEEYLDIMRRDGVALICPETPDKSKG